MDREDYGLLRDLRSGYGGFSGEAADGALGYSRPGDGVFRRCAEGSLGCSPDNRLGRLCRNIGI